VSLQLNDQALITVIADNGRGFDPAHTSGEGNGLTNMRRRLADIGGSLEITSAPGQGTTVRFVVPRQALHARVIAANGAPHPSS
jgi:signal transduction histidine kinase